MCVTVCAQSKLLLLLLTVTKGDRLEEKKEIEDTVTTHTHTRITFTTLAQTTVSHLTVPVKVKKKNQILEMKTISE